MGRSPRIQSTQMIFHVINRGNGRSAVFHSSKDYQEYLDLLNRYKEKFSIHVYHYVLMPNHIHFLLEPTIESTLSRFMQGLTLAHTRRFNMRKRSVGHVWQGRFKSIPIETDAYFLQCGRYIELNPVRAGIVSHPSQYRWSSYAFYTQGKIDKLITSHSLYDALGSTSSRRQSQYTRYIDEELPKVTDHISVCFSRELAYGSEDFVQKLAHDFNYKIERKRAGRPKKTRPDTDFSTDFSWMV